MSTGGHPQATDFRTSGRDLSPPTLRALHPAEPPVQRPPRTNPTRMNLTPPGMANPLSTRSARHAPDCFERTTNFLHIGRGCGCEYPSDPAASDAKVPDDISTNQPQRCFRPNLSQECVYSGAAQPWPPVLRRNGVEDNRRLRIEVHNSMPQPFPIW